MGNAKEIKMTLNEVLTSEFTVEPLRSIAKYCKLGSSGIKEDLVKKLENYIKSNLQSLYSNLENIHKLVVQETVHNYKGKFEGFDFVTKYNYKPSFLSNSIYSIKNLQTLSLILLCGEIPQDILQELETFVPKPEKSKLRTFETLPQKDNLDYIYWDGKNNEETLTQDELFIREMEQEAFQNIRTIFSFMQSKKLSGSVKTDKLSLASQKLISENLLHKDYFDEDDMLIQSFSLPLILLNANLCKYNGSKLELTTKGFKYLTEKPENLLKECWKQWLNSMFDEFSRIDVIKGQQKGLYKNAKERREQICRGLKKLPDNVWISFSDFSKFLILNQCKFYLTKEEWRLYILNKEYGSLGYDGYHTWEIIQERYLLVFLFEYIAPLGMIDIAYTYPEGIKNDYSHLWGVDDLSFFSRYDGLLYFRINPLGSYILEKSNEYISKIKEVSKTMKLLPNLEITINNETIQSEQIFLESIAKKVSDFVYKLDESLVLNQVENGSSLQDIKNSILSRAEQEKFPVTFKDFFDRIERNSNPFEVLGHARVLKVKDKATALLIAHDKNLKKFCYYSEPNFLIVLHKNEKDFFKQIKVLGYVVSKSILL